MGHLRSVVSELDWLSADGFFFSCFHGVILSDLPFWLNSWNCRNTWLQVYSGHVIAKPKKRGDSLIAVGSPFGALSPLHFQNRYLKFSCICSASIIVSVSSSWLISWQMLWATAGHTWFCSMEVRVIWMGSGNWRCLFVRDFLCAYECLVVWANSVSVGIVSNLWPPTRGPPSLLMADVRCLPGRLYIIFSWSIVFLYLYSQDCLVNDHHVSTVDNHHVCTVNNHLVCTSLLLTFSYWLIHLDFRHGRGPGIWWARQSCGHAYTTTATTRWCCWSTGTSAWYYF